MKRLLLLDMDLTIVDSNKAGILAYKKVLKKHGLKMPTHRELKGVSGMERKEKIEYFYPELNNKQTETVCNEIAKVLMGETTKYVKAFPGIKGTLKKLSKNYELGIASNANHKRIVAYLNKVGIDLRLFEVIIGNDDVKHSKPCPDEVFLAEKLTKLNVAYMVGDSIYDMIAAKKSRTKAIGVLTGNTSRYKLKKYGAWKVIDSIKDLPKII